MKHGNSEYAFSFFTITFQFLVMEVLKSPYLKAKTTVVYTFLFDAQFRSVFRLVLSCTVFVYSDKTLLLDYNNKAHLVGYVSLF